MAELLIAASSAVLGSSIVSALLVASLHRQVKQLSLLSKQLVEEIRSAKKELETMRGNA